MDLWVKNGEIGKAVGRYRPPTNLFLLWGVYTSVSSLVKIDKKVRPWEWLHTDRQPDRQTDGNRFYYLSHAICYSYGADNNAVWRKTVSTARSSYASAVLGDRNSVRPPDSLSVWHTRALWRNYITYTADISIPNERVLTLVFRHQ